MNRLLRIAIITAISVFILSTINSCHKKGPSNPYLHMKSKPSQEEKKQNQKIIKRSTKVYKKQLGDNRKRVFGRRKAPKE